MPQNQSFSSPISSLSLRHRILTLAAILALMLVQTTVAQEFDASRFRLDNARIIIGDGAIIEQGSLLVQGDSIIAIGQRSDFDEDESGEVIDLSGKTIMPALIDSHAHLGYEAHIDWGAKNYTRENLIDHLQRYAFYGFSAVFSAGSDPDDMAFDVQRAQLDGEFSGARFLFAAGMAPPGQGPNDQFLAHALNLEQQTGQRILYGVASEEDAAESVRQIAERSIGVIKIWVDDRGGSQEKLSKPLYRAIAEEARANGIAVYAHQQFASDMPDLLEAGITGFLHGRIGSGLDQEVAEQVAQNNAFVVPNLGLGELRREAIGLDPFLGLSVPASVTARLEESEQRLIAPQRSADRETELQTSFAHLIEAGVDILLGTDAGAVPNHFFGYTGHRELEIFVRLGMTPMQAIIAGTSKPAARLGIESLGLLRAGYSADFLVLDANPLDDIRNTRSISSVYLMGKEIDRAGLASGFLD